MQTNGDDAHLAVARAKFKPVARALEDVSKNLQQEHGRSAVLQQKSPMQPISQNACMVQYSLQHPNEARLSLTFIVVGDEADCVLLQGQERSGPWDTGANPGQVDQHVYGVDELEDIKAAVREKISAHLQACALH
jgi:hypothetical protein